MTVGLKVVHGDGKYNNRELARYIAGSDIDPEIGVIGRPRGSKGFVNLPKRWVVERTFAWFDR